MEEGAPEQPDLREDGASSGAEAEAAVDPAPSAVVPPAGIPPAAIPPGKQAIHPDWVAAERLASRWLWSLVGTGATAALIFARLTGTFDHRELILFGIPAALAIGFLYGLGQRWPGWEYPHRAWRLGEVSFDVWKGLLVRHRIRVPLSRVQYTDVVQGPIQRRFGLGTLRVHVAGTEAATVSLEGIRHELAIALRDLLIEAGGDDAV